MVYFNGTTYDGEWKADLPHGTGKITTAQGVKYDGSFEEGRVCYFFIIFSCDLFEFNQRREFLQIQCGLTNLKLMDLVLVSVFDFKNVLK